MKKPLAAVAQLKALLRDGGLDSRIATESMTSAGFTPAQTRKAREQLGVVMVRQGNRTSMSSTWRLPAGDAEESREARTNGPAEAAPHEQLGTVDVSRFGADPTAEALAGPRFKRRVEFLLQLGLDDAAATRLASALGARDLNAPFTVSCAECQAWGREEWCRTQRPASDLHRCQLARLCAP